MNFLDLKQGIKKLSDSFRQSAAAAVNVHLTIRNWLMGFYIVEYEQNGEDRAKYGAKLLQNLADEFDEEGFSYRNLKLYRQFYNCYPQIKTVIPQFIKNNFDTIGQSLIMQLQSADNDGVGIGQTVSAQFKNDDEAIGQTVSAQFKNDDVAIGQTLSAQLQVTNNEDNTIGQTPSAQFKNQEEEQKFIIAQKLISRLSFSHISLLLPIEDPLKRLFYEIECIKGTWSVRELKRQIDSLYFERSGISQNPEKLSKITQENSETANMLDTIKSPFIFEFMGLKSKEVVYESDLEQALIEHLEEFIMELGNGYCFEARQKRILIGDEYFFCDLVFYNRILKCHVLIELKISSFSYEHFGQLKTFVNYYRKEVMRADDNPPVGILLVTNKNQALVEYATADSDKEIFVSKYLLELPTKEQLIKFMEEEFSKL